LKKKEKETAKSLLVKQETPTFAVRLKKRGKFFTKQIDYHSERFRFYLKINDEKFGRNNKTLTFALPNKTGWQLKVTKIFESWKTIALISPEYNREARDNK
jgi:hypothetical protein